MGYKSDNYKPNKTSRAILARAWDHVQSVPYAVTARWLFYRLLQDGLYSSKADYGRFLALTSRARHNCWQGWRPHTLTDDTRQVHEHERGYATVAEWVRRLGDATYTASLDHWHRQTYYAECWFEATGMYRQFEHYTRGMTLRPFAGAPSIPYKYQAAQDIEAHARRYGLPIVILYFGDYDQAGLTIPATAVSDVREWCAVDFDVVRGGLNEGDAERLGIPENFEKPGQYQWEALPDRAARELITTTIAPFVDVHIIADTQREAHKAGARLAWLQNEPSAPTRARVHGSHAQSSPWGRWLHHTRRGSSEK